MNPICSRNDRSSSKPALQEVNKRPCCAQQRANNFTCCHIRWKMHKESAILTPGPASALILKCNASTDLPTLKYFCQYSEQPLSVFSDFLPDFLQMHHQSTKAKVSNDNFSIIHLVRTVCELTSLINIIQMHYTRMILFCLHLRKSFSIENRRSLSPKAMHRVCCFH